MSFKGPFQPKPFYEMLVPLLLIVPLAGDKRQLRLNTGSWKTRSSYQESCAGGERKAGVGMVELLRKGKRVLGRRAQESIQREASFTHRAAGTELKSPDQEPGREAPHLWVADLQGVCCKVRCRNTFNRVINCCPSRKVN